VSDHVETTWVAQVRFVEAVVVDACGVATEAVPAPSAATPAKTPATTTRIVLILRP
jgi:hypothetical protein